MLNNMEVERGPRLTARKIDALIIAGWIAAMAVTFVPALVTGDRAPDSGLWFSEMPLAFIPYYSYTGSMLKGGLAPTWSPQIFCGFPYYGYPPTNLYAPWYYLLMYLDYARYSTANSLLFFALGGALAYLCFRRLGLGPAASLVGLLASAGGVHFTLIAGYFCFEEHVLVFALLCWGLIGLSGPVWRWRDWMALMLGVAMLMTYQFELAVYCAVFCLAAALVPRGGRWRRVLVVGGAFAAAGLCMAVVHLSLAEYSRLNVRSAGVTLSYYLSNRSSRLMIQSMFLPLRVLYINLSYTYYYIGLSVCWLGALALVRRRAGARALFAGTVITAMAAMDIWPLPRILYHVPVLNQLLLRSWIFPLVAVQAAALAALGAQSLFRENVGRRWPWSLLAVMGLAAFSSAAWYRDVPRAVLLAAGSLLAAAAAYRPALMDPRTRRRAFILGLVFADVTLLAFENRPWLNPSPMEVHPEARELLTHAGMERFWPLSKAYFMDSQVNANMGMRLDPLLRGTSSPRGYWRAPPLRLAHLLNVISPGYLDFEGGRLNRVWMDKGAGPDPFGPEAGPLLTLLNVGWIISNGVKVSGLAGWDFRPGRELLFYHNSRVLPRVRAVGRWKVARGADESLALTRAASADFAGEAVLESRSGDLSPSAAAGPPVRTAVRDFRPGYWDISISPGPGGSGDSAVIIAETLVPGWRAFLDGTEVPIHYAYHALMGVRVPAGSHRLVLRHEPSGFRLGLWVSMASIAGCFGFYLAGKRRGRLV